MIMQLTAIGLVETSSIAKGIEASDAMLKAAEVELVLSRTICSGKLITLVAGDVAAVEAAVKAGVEIGRETVVDSFVIPNVHPQVIEAISGTVVAENPDAMGIVEAFSVGSLIEGADAAAKASEVQLLRIHLAMAIGGKAFVTLTGDVAAVQAAVEAASEIISSKGLLTYAVVIPGPRAELFRDHI
jgi:microcompartment protein CcmL/EutN